MTEANGLRGKVIIMCDKAKKMEFTLKKISISVIYEGLCFSFCEQSKPSLSPSKTFIDLLLIHSTQGSFNKSLTFVQNWKHKD